MTFFDDLKDWGILLFIRVNSRMIIIKKPSKCHGICGFLFLNYVQVKIGHQIGLKPSKMASK
jgi:hypothetical protein